MDGDLEPAHVTVRRIAAREVSPLEVVEAAEAAYTARNGALNAIVTPVFEAAKREALAVERRIMRDGAELRPLEGLPLAVKDSVPTAGVRTTFGSPLFSDNVPSDDALHVARLRAAGAILVGKSNTPELEVGINTRNPVFGQTLNPHDPSRGAGGSSGGSAVAVATGMCAIADGTDHGGSVRIPASVVGVVGFRPSPGRIPLYPSTWVYDTLAVPGALARSARDVALMASVMSGPDPRVPISRDPIATPEVPNLRGWRIAWSPDLAGQLAVEPDVARAVERAAAHLRHLGCEVEAACPDWGDAADIIGALRSYRTAIVMDALKDRQDAIGNGWLREFIECADRLSLAELGRAEAARSRYWERTASFFARYRLLLMPATQWPAFPRELDFPTQVGGRTMSGVVEAILSTYVVTIAGLPAISVPCGTTSSGLPIGLQIVGGWQRDEDVLAAAIAFEESFS